MALDLHLVWATFSGFMFGLGGYTFREASEIFNKGLKGLKAGIEDWLGSLIGGGVTFAVIVLLWC
jgi:hypothetical protein